MKYLLKRFYFNYKEFQFRNLYAFYANKRQTPVTKVSKFGVKNDNVIGALESTISNVLFRTGMFISPHSVRYAIAHKQVFLNDGLIRSTKIMLKDGDIVTFSSDDLKKKFLAVFLRRIAQHVYYTPKGKKYRFAKSILARLIVPMGNSRYLLLLPKLCAVQFVEKPKVHQVYYPFPLNLLEFNAHYKGLS